LRYWENATVNNEEVEIVDFEKPSGITGSLKISIIIIVVGLIVSYATLNYLSKLPDEDLTYIENK
jgi:hypothetical protein